MAEKASSDTGVCPTHRTLRHFTQINTDVDKVIAIATESISYIKAPLVTSQTLEHYPTGAVAHHLARPSLAWFLTMLSMAACRYLSAVFS